MSLIQKYYEIENTNTTRINYAKILLWNNKIKESTTIAQQFLYDEKFLTDYIESFNDYLFLLLAKEQYPFLYTYFTSAKATELNIKDQLKPIWYTLMYYMQEAHPNEYLRMGTELEETVKEMIAKVEEMREEYK